MPIPSQNDFLLPFLNLLSDGQKLNRRQMIYLWEVYDVLDVSQWKTWLTQLPVDPFVAHEDTRS